jgi:tetratricopeptide (TPR) repeat protein
MSDPTPSLGSELESLVGQVIEEFQQRAARGEQPAVEDYARRHPPIAEVLRQVLPTVRLLQEPAAGAAPPRPPSDLEGYEILREVGRGGMGVVYEARHLRLNRVVALKMVLAGRHARPEDLLRFLAEAEAVARLQHPNIVQVFETGHHNGLPYFTLEFVAGGSLSARLNGTPLRPSDAAPLLETLARAVHHAHQKGVIHRDLKPANVLLAAGGVASAGQDGSAKPQAVPKITDFGLAKRVEGGASLTRAGAILGTPGYMAPEQARGGTREVGPHTDTWALGAILYECLTGRPPFQGPAPADTLLQVIHDEPVPPRRLQPGVPRDLETICLKCLQKEPARRYATAEALADDLQRFQAGEPIRARPVGPLGRGWRWCRRNPAVAALTTLTALVFVAGFVLVAVQGRRAQRNFTAAEAERRRADGERDRAEEEKQVAEAVRGFLEHGLLLQADPGTQADTLRVWGGGLTPTDDPTVKGLLDRAAAELAPDRIEAKFPRQPRVQAEVLRTVGYAYLGVGEYRQAIDHLARARDQMSGVLGVDHPYTLTTSHNLAVAHLLAGHTAEAVTLLEEVRDARRIGLGPDDPNTLTTLDNLAVAYREAGEGARAIALLEEVRAAREARVGPMHPSTLPTLDHLGAAYQRAGRTGEAIALLEQVRDAREDTPGRDHPSTLTTLHNLAVAYREAGRAADAIALFEEVRDARLEKLGLLHRDTLLTLIELALAYGKGPSVKTVRLLEEVRGACELAPPLPEFSEHLVALNRVGSRSGSPEKKPEALPLLERTRDACVSRLGPDHPQTLLTMNSLALACWAGKLDRSVPLFEETLRLREAALGPNHPDTLVTMVNLGVNYRAVGKQAEGVVLLEEALARARKGPGPRPVARAGKDPGPRGLAHTEFRSIALVLAETYDRSALYARSEPLYQEVIEKHRKTYGPAQPPEVADQLNLARNLLRQRKGRDAERILTQVVAMFQQTPLPSSGWRAFEAKALLGRALLDQEKYDEAEALLRAGYQGLKVRRAQVPLHERVRLREALDWLIELAESREDKEAAEKWRKEREAAYPR